MKQPEKDPIGATYLRADLDADRDGNPCAFAAVRVLLRVDVNGSEWLTIVENGEYFVSTAPYGWVAKYWEKISRE